MKESARCAMAPLVVAVLLFLLFLPYPAHAVEVILSYASEIVVREDASLEVTETIRVRAEGEKIKRGIYRDFPTRYRGEGGLPRVVGFSVREVLRDGVPEPYHVKDESNGKRVYIGQKDVFLNPGVYTYTLVYSTTFQLGFFEGHDELYWNVTGSGWDFPIEEASASVVLPAGASQGILSFDAYTGPQGAKGKDFRASAAPSGTVGFSTTRPLGPREGLTIVVAWKKGFVREPPAVERMHALLSDSRGSLTGLAGAAVVLLYYLIVWFMVGRDPRRGAMVTRYTPPEGMSPAVMRYLSLMGYDQKAFAAAVISMAVKGHIRITEDYGEYTLTKTEGREPLNAEEQKVLKKLLEDRAEIAISKENHSRISAATTALSDHLSARYHKLYFVYNGWYFAGGVLITVAAILLGGFATAKAKGALEQFLFMSLWLSLWSVGVIMLAWFLARSWKKVLTGRSKPSDVGGAVFLTLFALPFFGGELFGLYIMWSATSLVIMLMVPALFGLNVLFYRLLKAPTLAGRRLLDAIEGFRVFLAATEKDRLNMLNPPDKTPALFERFLPYALALGVEQQWAEQFSGLLSTAAAGEATGGYSPAWFSGTSLSGFAAGTFASSLGDSFSDSISSASTAPGSTSGSSGGGSSGGGGGGGGGGGW